MHTKLLKIVNSCITCKVPTCSKYCMLHLPINDIMKLLQEGREEDAATLLYNNTVFPFVCGKLCDVNRKCYGHCVKSKMNGAVKFSSVEAYLGHKWCNYWVHMGFLNDKSGKMSKSKGEFLTVSLLESKGYNPLSYRYLCLNSYYHNQLVFSYDILDGAQKAYLKLKNRVSKLGVGEVNSEKYDLYVKKFGDCIEDDLNTSNMVTLVYDVLKDESLNDGTKRKIISKFDEVLSLDLFKEEEKKNSHDEKMINEKIKLRNEAKKNKDFAKADKIRDELLEMGIRLIDTREGTTYEVI